MCKNIINIKNYLNKNKITTNRIALPPLSNAHKLYSEVVLFHYTHK